MTDESYDFDNDNPKYSKGRWQDPREVQIKEIGQEDFTTDIDNTKTGLNS